MVKKKYKKRVSVHLDKPLKELLEKLSQYYGVSMSAVVSILVRKDAEEKGLAEVSPGK